MRAVASAFEVDRARGRPFLRPLKRHEMLMLPPNGTYVIPEGMWFIVVETTAVVLQLFDGNNWVGGGTPAGLVISDGRSVRLLNTDPSVSRRVWLR
ncbi:MAG: hypothetical protein QXI60_03110 [Thermofilaceae archaeon]